MIILIGLWRSKSVCMRGGVINAGPITLQRTMRPTKCTYCLWVIFHLWAVDCNLLLLRQQLMCFMETACEIIFRRSFSLFSYHKNESISKQAFCLNCHEVILINEKGSWAIRAFYAQKRKLYFLSTLTDTYYISHALRLYTCGNILVKRGYCSNWSVIACKTFYFRVHFILFDQLFIRPQFIIFVWSVNTLYTHVLCLCKTSWALIKWSQWVSNNTFWFLYFRLKTVCGCMSIQAKKWENEIKKNWNVTSKTR